jgi:hypothetical protein
MAGKKQLFPAKKFGPQEQKSRLESWTNDPIPW